MFILRKSPDSGDFFNTRTPVRRGCMREVFPKCPEKNGTFGTGTGKEKGRLVEGRPSRESVALHGVTPSVRRGRLCRQSRIRSVR